MPKLTDRQKAERDLIKAEMASKKACMRRGDLPSGASRAALTTANARWMTLAEHRDRLLSRFEEAYGNSASVIASAELK